MCLVRRILQFEVLQCLNYFTGQAFRFELRAKKVFFCCAHYPRFLKTDAMCLQDLVESLSLSLFFFFYWSCLLHFSMVCFTTKTEAVKRLTVNHRVPIRTHMRNKETALSAGKREWPSHISLVEMGTVFLDQSQCDGKDYFRHTIEDRSNANAGCNCSLKSHGPYFIATV